MKLMVVTSAPLEPERAAIVANQLGFIQYGEECEVMAVLVDEWYSSALDWQPDVIVMITGNLTAGAYFQTTAQFAVLARQTEIYTLIRLEDAVHEWTNPTTAYHMGSGLEPSILVR